MGVNGSFTTASPLGANLSGQDITSQVTAFSFSDGITTYANTNPNAWIYLFVVTTGASARVTSVSILLEVWQTGASPHSADDRFVYMSISGLSVNTVRNNGVCELVGTTPSGVAGCPIEGSTPALDSSFASAGAGTFAFQTATTAVPALDRWGLISLSIGLMPVAWLLLRRREESVRA